MKGNRYSSYWGAVGKINFGLFKHVTKPKEKYTMKGTPKLIVVTAIGMTVAVIAAEFLMNKTELGKIVA